MVTLATSQVVGDNREFDVSGIFWGILLIVCGGELMTNKDSLLNAHGYQLLSIETSYLVGNNREFDVIDIFWGVLFIVCRGELMTIEDQSLSAYGYPSNQSVTGW